MSVLPVYLYGHPVLRKKAKPVMKFDPALEQFASDMAETMRNANGIGLAATQVGDLRRVIVVDIGETSEETRGMEPLVMINPVLIRETDTWTMEEGCLSIPEVRDEVERVEAITVSYRDLAFEHREITASGLLGRVILHEIDHLNGVLFLDYLGAARQKLLKGRLNKIRRGEVETLYPVIAAEGEKEYDGSQIRDQR